MRTCRKELATILYGSQNYGLAGPESDKDYHTIILPSSYDLYYNKQADEGWDVRKFTKLVFDGNFNAIELLFSCQIEFYDETFMEYFDWLKSVAENIVFRRSKAFACSIRGCFNASMENAEKAKDYQTLVKYISRAVYFYDFLYGLVKQDFYIEKLWRGKASENARKIRFKYLPFDKDAIIYNMNWICKGFQRTEQIPSDYYEKAVEFFYKMMEDERTDEEFYAERIEND